MGAFGIDLSPEMVAIARPDYPGLRFELGAMTSLDLADDSVAARVSPDCLMGVFTVGSRRRTMRSQPLILRGGAHDDDTGAQWS